MGDNMGATMEVELFLLWNPDAELDADSVVILGTNDVRSEPFSGGSVLCVL